MNKYTVIFTESWLAGSHWQTITKMRHVEAKNPEEALKPFNGTAVFIFPGHHDSL